MDAVGVGFEGNFYRAVEEDAGVLIDGADCGDDLLREGEEHGGFEVFFADLDVVDIVFSPGAGEGDERGASFGFVAGSGCWEQAAVGDGVEEHRA